MLPVCLKTDGTTTGQDGASLPQLAAISSPLWRDRGRRDSLTGDDGTSNMFSHTNYWVDVAGLQMFRAKYDSRKLTRRFAQDDSRNRDDSRNSMDISRKQAAMLCFFQI